MNWIDFALVKTQCSESTTSNRIVRHGIANVLQYFTAMYRPILCTLNMQLASQ